MARVSRAFSWVDLFVRPGCAVRSAGINPRGLGVPCGCGG